MRPARCVTLGPGGFRLQVGLCLCSELDFCRLQSAPPSLLSSIFGSALVTAHCFPLAIIIY